MLLGRNGLVQAIQEGLLKIVGEGLSVFGEASQDVRVGDLYVPKGGKLPAPDKRTGKIKHGRQVMTQEQFIDRYLVEASLSEPRVLEAGRGKYFFLPMERISLAHDLSAFITSRSRAGRDGYKTASVGWFKDSIEDREGGVEDIRPLCTLTSRTNIILRKGDRISQMFVDLNGDRYLSLEELQQMISGGQLAVEVKKGDRRGNRRLALDEMVFSHGLVLHRGPHVKVYNGEVIDPYDTDKEEYAFDVRKIPAKGLKLDAGSFVISSSREYFTYPEGHIAYVAENRGDWIYAVYGAARGKVDFKGSTHPNVPFVIRRGTIVFENFYRHPTTIYAREPQSELFLAPLHGSVRYKDFKKSPFDDQRGPRAGRSIRD